MQAIHSGARFLIAMSALTLAAGPGLAAAPTSASVLPTPDAIDPAIVRAATAPAPTLTPAPVSKGLSSGEGGVKCLVKFFEPDVLKTQGNKWSKKDFETIVFLQTKLICTDTVGVSEILIEQNDQLVVAGSVTNNQTDVTLHNITAKLNEEQQDTFCVAVARQSGSAFSVIAQECWHGLGGFHKGYGGDGYGRDTFGGGYGDSRSGDRRGPSSDSGSEWSDRSGANSGGSGRSNQDGANTSGGRGGRN